MQIFTLYDVFVFGQIKCVFETYWSSFMRQEYDGEDCGDDMFVINLN